MKIIDHPSPNWDERGTAIDMLIFHYTDMLNAEAALARLCDPVAQVSAHYLIDEEGKIYRLVPEEYRAWHAGKSYWAGEININARSIGIELANPGHSNGYRPFPKEQMMALIELSRDIIGRHAIPTKRILGHSDIAPSRKMDPGELFDWRYLAEQGIGFFPRAEEISASEEDFFRALYSFGYDLHCPKEDLVMAFCRHYRPNHLVDRPDKELIHLALALVDDQAARA